MSEVFNIPEKVAFAANLVGLREEYTPIRELYFDLIARSVGMSCDSFAAVFLGEYKKRLFKSARYLRMGSVNAGPQKESGGAKAYAHTASGVFLIKGDTPRLILDPIAPGPMGVGQINVRAEYRARIAPPVWRAALIERYAGAIGEATAGIKIDRQAAPITFFELDDFLSNARRNPKAW